MNIDGLGDLYRIEKGWVWPKADIYCAKAILQRESVKDLKLAVRNCRGNRVAVQAGGNCGVWPVALASMFESVYTFEPDSVNFTALTINTAALPNVIKMQAALGDAHEMISLVRAKPENCGAYHVDPTKAGDVPTLCIDDLGLHACDLIALDVEGREEWALDGAVETIREFHPVIILEDKGLSDRYGRAQGSAPAFLLGQGYRVFKKIHRDVILVPR